jgi:hypothetical protein
MVEFHCDQRWMRYDLFALALRLRYLKILRSRFLKIGCARAALRYIARYSARYDKRAKMAKNCHHRS